MLGLRHVNYARSILVGATVLAACSSDTTSIRDATGVAPTASFARGPDAQGGPTIQGIISVTVSPATSTIPVSGTVQLSATALNHAGQTFTSTKAIWSSSATAVATVSTSGLVTGITSGVATITASAKNGVSGTATVNVTGTPATQTLIAAGDIAVCNTTYDEATANLIDGIPGTVAILGDIAYPNGSAADFANCFAPSWGRHKARTRPSPGNHEYVTAGAAGYFGYFGAAAGDPSKGYYSYDLGNWHLIALNSNCAFVSCSAGSPQETWLRADLAATTKPCILAYWHHPRFSSSATYGNDTRSDAFWVALVQARADIVLTGHAHMYERFDPQNALGVADPNGMRAFTVGTGGKSPLHGIGTIKANSVVRGNVAYGVIKLTLGAGTYSWQFVPVAGSTWTDSGSGTCN